MLKLNKKTEYALIALRHIGVKPKREWASVHEIARDHELPLELLAKIMQSLKRAGILVSVQGFRGGYAFARDPRRLGFVDLLEVFDERTALTDCCDGEKPACRRGPRCEVREVLGVLNERLMRELKDLSLADVLDLEGGTPILRRAG